MNYELFTLAGGVAYGVVAADASLHDIGELAAYHLLAYRGDVVDVDHTLEVVTLVLHDAGEESGDDFLMLLEIFVKPVEAYVLDALYVLRESGEAEAPFGAVDFVAVEHFDFGIDEHHLFACAVGKRFGYGVGVDDDEAYAFAYLGSGETDTFGGVHRLEHVGDESFEAGIVGRHVVSDFAKHRVAVEIYRKIHIVVYVFVIR